MLCINIVYYLKKMSLYLGNNSNIVSALVIDLKLFQFVKEMLRSLWWLLEFFMIHAITSIVHKIKYTVILKRRVLNKMLKIILDMDHNDVLFHDQNTS